MVVTLLLTNDEVGLQAFVLAGRVNHFLHYFLRAELCLLLRGEETPFMCLGQWCAVGVRCLQDGAVAVLEVLLMKYLDSVSIPVLSSV